MGRACALALALVAAAMVVAVPMAEADTAGIIAPSDPHSPQVDSGWQAGTCTSDTPTCSVATPGQFFEQAAGHPQVGFTQFIVKHSTVGPLETPEGELETVRVDLPVGLSVNPGAAERCPLETFESGASGCPIGSKVGESAVTASLLGVPSPPTPPLTLVPVYNVVPPNGEPALFGLELAGHEVFLKADISWDGDYHEGFTIAVPRVAELEPLVKGLILKNRLVFDGRAGDGTFITTPSTCLGPAVAPHEHDYSTYLLAGSYAEEAAQGYEFPASAAPALESPIPPGTEPRECDTIPYEPSIGVDPNTAETDSPSGAAVTVTVPHLLPGEDPHEQDSSDTRTAAVRLPSGMGINPSAANGLQACSDEQFGKGTRDPVACPAASKIGTVEITSPPLPEGNLTGDVYVGRQESRDPASGNEYRIFVDAESARYGISVRLVGNVSADPKTGQLTTTFSETPQVPFTSFELEFDGGPTATLTSPPICGPNATTARMTPWSGNPDATPEAGFTLTTAPGGGACAKALAARPFAPSFAAETTNHQGGAYTKLNVDIARSDGNQELKGATIDLPPGLTAKLAGVAYCPESALAAAAASSGIAEAAGSSCPSASQIGSASIAAGSGSSPFHIDGKAFLAGPYDGAPLSLAIVTPATAGPFDLGTVVVRVALFVDPETAQIHAVSDPIPHVFGGALLDLRSVAVHIDRNQFSINPTNCSPMAVAATLRGGGADPTDPAAFSADPVSTPFQASGCEKLGFEPKLHLRLFGGMSRAQSPRLRAVLQAREGDANISRAAVALPHALILKQSSLSKICTRVQFAAHECPSGSVYGFARAFTPLLDKPLEGPVYLRSSDNLLPDLVAALHGQVDINLVGRVDTFHGGLRTTYDTVPDVPVSKFILTLPGGRRGLLVNSRNLCGRKGVRAIVRLKAQNGKKANQRRKLRTSCPKKARHRRGRDHRR